MPGAGITALVDGRRVAAGTPALLAAAAGVAGAEVAAAQAALEAEGGLDAVLLGCGVLEELILHKQVPRISLLEAEGGLGWVGLLC